MPDDLERIHREALRLINELQGYIGKALNEILKDATDPAAMINILKGMGLDAASLSGLVSQQPAFNPYRLLNLDSSASDEAVKRRYRELVHRLHPDTSGTEGTGVLFQMVTEAYETIKRERRWQ